MMVSLDRPLPGAVIATRGAIVMMTLNAYQCAVLGTVWVIRAPLQAPVPRQGINSVILGFDNEGAGSRGGYCHSVDTPLAGMIP